MFLPYRHKGEDISLPFRGLAFACRRSSVGASLLIDHSSHWVSTEDVLEISSVLDLLQRTFVLEL